MAVLNSTTVGGKLTVNGAISQNGALLSDTYAAKSHSHTWDSITGKPSTFTPASHTHSYAGSSSAGGAATSANSIKIGSTYYTLSFSNGELTFTAV